MPASAAKVPLRNVSFALPPDDASAGLLHRSSAIAAQPHSNSGSVCLAKATRSSTRVRRREPRRVDRPGTDMRFARHRGGDRRLGDRLEAARQTLQARVIPEPDFRLIQPFRHFCRTPSAPARWPAASPRVGWVRDDKSLRRRNIRRARHGYRKSRIILGAAARQDGSGMRLVRALVLGKADVAIEPEQRSLAVAFQRQPALAKAAARSSTRSPNGALICAS